MTKRTAKTVHGITLTESENNDIEVSYESQIIGSIAGKIKATDLGWEILVTIPDPTIDHPTKLKNNNQTTHRELPEAIAKLGKDIIDAEKSAEQFKKEQDNLTNSMQKQRDELFE